MFCNNYCIKGPRDVENCELDYAGEVIANQPGSFKLCDGLFTYDFECCPLCDHGAKKNWNTCCNICLMSITCWALPFMCPCRLCWKLCCKDCCTGCCDDCYPDDPAECCRNVCCCFCYCLYGLATIFSG